MARMKQGDYTFTQRALAGDRFAELKAVDMHCHLRWHNGYFYTGGWIDTMLADADLVGVEKLMVVSHASMGVDFEWGNAVTAEAVAAHPDRVMGFVCLNPHKVEESKAQIDKYYNTPGFVGTKIHPSFQGYPVNGPAYDELFRYLSGRGGIMLVHTWDDCPNGSIDMNESIMKKFPDVTFMLAHAGGIPTGVKKSIDLVNRYPHIYMDTCGFDHHEHSLPQIVDQVEDIGKILYGSDIPFHDIRYATSHVLTADLTDQEKTAIMRDNINALLAKVPVKG